MASNSAEIKWASDDAAVTRSLEKMERNLDKLAQKLDKVESSSKKAADATTRGMQEAANQSARFAQEVAGVAISLTGAQQVVSAIKSEYDALVQRQAAAATAQLTAGQSLREMRKAFAPDATVGGKDVERMVQEIVGRTGSSVPIAAAVAQTAFSAKGDLSNKGALSAVETALRMAPQDVGEASTLAGRYLDVMKATGQGDARSVAAFLQTVQQSSRITNMGSVGKNLVPAITALVKSGNSPEQAAELSATLNQLMSDEEGSLTRTAVIGLDSQLQDFVPGAKGKDARGGFQVPAEQIAAYEAARNATERIGVMQQSPELLRQFRGKASFEKASQNFIYGLLGGEAASVAAMKQTQGNIPALGPELIPLAEEQMNFINGGAFQMPVDVANQAAAALEAKRLADRKGAIASQARQAYSETMGEIGFGFGMFDAIPKGIEGFGMNRMIDMSSNPAATVANRFRRQLDESMTPEERQLIEKQIAAMDRLAAAYETEAAEPQQRVPAAAAVGR